MRNLLRSRTNGAKQAEEGFVLILVLVFLLGASLIIGALLSAASTSQLATDVQTLGHSDDYSVDAGIEYGIHLLRTNPTFCPDISASNTVTVPTAIDGAQPKVTCTTTSGSLTSTSDFAIVELDPNATTGPSAPFQTQSGNGTVKCILGPTYVTGGVDLQAQTQVDATTPCTGSGAGQVLGDGTGTFFYHKSDCTTHLATPNNLWTGPPGGPTSWTCTTATAGLNTSLPSNDLLAAMPAGNPSPVPVGGCSVFTPGKYTTLPTFSANNYLASGIYYFDNVGKIDLGSNALFGGQPSSLTESQIVTTSQPCSSDTKAHAGSGTGVEIILGGNSSLYSNKGDMELYARQPASSNVAKCKTEVANSQPLVDCEGTPGISIRTVPSSAPAGWDASTLGGTGMAFSNASGNPGHTAVHGLIYVPEGSVSLSATNTNQAESTGGLVAWDVSLQASSSASGLVVSVQTNPTIRTTTLTSSVSEGGKLVTATAVVEVANDGATKTVVVDSWTVNNP